MTNTKARKLTDRQREVLGVLAKRDMRIGEFFSGWYLWNSQNDQWEFANESRVHRSTAEALQRHGLIIESKSPDEFCISPAGRQALNG